MEEYIIKVCGIKNNCNNNFSIKHIKYLVSLMSEKFYIEKRIDGTLMELIAGITFVITGDFVTLLSENEDVLDDIKKTRENLEKLERYFIAESIQNKNTYDLRL